MLNDFVASIAAPYDGTRNDPFWTSMSSSLALANLLLLMECGKKEEVHPASFANLCSAKSLDKLEDIARYNIDPESIAGMNYNGVFVSADKTKQSIFVSLFAMVNVFNTQKKLTRMLSDSSFDICDIGRRKTAVYIIVPDEKTTCHTDAFTKKYDNFTDLCREYGLMYDKFIVSEKVGRIEAAPSALTIAIAACAFFESEFRDQCGLFVQKFRNFQQRKTKRNEFNHMLFTVGAVVFSRGYLMEEILFQHLYMIPEYLQNSLSPQYNTYEEIIVKSSVTYPLILYAARTGMQYAYNILLSAKCTDTEFFITLGKYGTAEQIWDYILHNALMYADIELLETPFSCVYLELMLMLRFDKSYLKNVMSLPANYRKSTDFIPMTQKNIFLWY